MTTMNWKQLLSSERRASSGGSSDSRSPFERDHDRLVFSSAFRRLQDKTQVFPLDPNDGVRTRLTHSIEVSAVARGLGSRAAGWLLEESEITPVQGHAIQVLCETAGLVHDIGNPPFGHFAEEVISEWCKCKVQDHIEVDSKLKDFLHFQGNAQTMRQIASLPTGTHVAGYGFTAATLSVCCKYIAAGDEVDPLSPGKAKLGYLASERDVVNWFRQQTGTGPSRHPLTFLVEAADDIVYSAADIEDAIRKRLLRISDVIDKLKGLEDGSTKEVLRDYEELRKRLGGDSEGPCAAVLRTALITNMTNAAFVVFQNSYGQILEGRFHDELLGKSKCVKLVDELKRLASVHAVNDQSVARLELFAKRVLEQLLDTFWDGAQTALKGDKQHKQASGLISKDFIEVAKNSKMSARYKQVQLVVDYVNGMTDSYAKRLHADLFNG